MTYSVGNENFTDPIDAFEYAREVKGTVVNDKGDVLMRHSVDESVSPETLTCAQGMYKIQKKFGVPKHKWDALDEISQ